MHLVYQDTRYMYQIYIILIPFVTYTATLAPKFNFILIYFCVVHFFIIVNFGSIAPGQLFVILQAVTKLSNIEN